MFPCSLLSSDFTPFLMTFSRHRLLMQHWCHSYTEPKLPFFPSLKFLTFMTWNPNGQLMKHAQQHLSVYGWRVCAHRFQIKDYSLGGMIKDFEVKTMGLGGIRALPGRQQRPPQSSGLGWERFVTEGWQSCFSTYTAISSLIIRSKEKGPGAQRGRGLSGLLQGSTCYYLCICLGVSLRLHKGIIFLKRPNP